MRKNVVIAILGTTLDGGFKETRWDRWRPTVAVHQQQDMPIHRLELLIDARSARLSELVISDIASVSPDTEIRVHMVQMEDSWDFSEVFTCLRDFAHGLQFDPETENYLVSTTTGTHVAQICWFLLTETRDIPGRLLQLAPAQGPGLPKSPIGSYRIIDLDLSRYDAISTRFAAEAVEASSFLKSGIATRNPAFNRMIDEIENVVIRSRAPVLLTGPTGAGKSQLAKRIFELKQSKRQVTGRFVEVNCATLRGEQAMSTLFGHVRGAFTGAQSDRPGLLKGAHKGILFLDEIGELGADEQAMCLRAIEEKKFLPVGGDRDIESDFQLIAGTNRDLAEDVRSGRFRADLLARLNLWTFSLPPLRERREDIEPNLEFELDRFYKAEGRRVSFNREAREAYLKFASLESSIWSANFRDLSASVSRMATLAPGGRIDVPTVQAEINRLKGMWRLAVDTDESEILAQVLGDRGSEFDPFELAGLEAAIRVCRESRSLSEAGRRLFAVSRQKKASGNDADRLRKYLARFNLSFADISVA